MKVWRNTLTGLATVALLAVAPTARAQTAVDLELALLVDVSGSVDANEYNLQRQGYINAFMSASVWNAISQGALQQIAVAYIVWSGSGQQSTLVNWTLINSQAAAQNFANLVGNTIRPFSGSTGIAGAINYGVNSVNTNAYNGTRQVLDVSGDGCENVTSLANLQAARNNALGAGGIETINGVVILGEANLQACYQNNVVGGAGGFVEVANSFDDFEAAIDRKLIREIAPTTVPEPMSVVLMATGLLAVGAAGLRRRRKNG